MSRSSKALITLSIFFCLCACSTKHKHSTSSQWKELDSFHHILAKVYHPIKDSANVQPARQLITVLVEKADSLNSSSIPENVNTSEMKLLIEQLAQNSRTLATEISQGIADSSIVKKIEPIHDQFHKIHELFGVEHKHDN